MALIAKYFTHLICLENLEWLALNQKNEFEHCKNINHNTLFEKKVLLIQTPTVKLLKTKKIQPKLDLLLQL